jgi:magnesium-transporting ATPase (P-type)
MMTVVVKDDKGKIIVFTKGADTSVEPLLSNPDEKDKTTMVHLNEFACQGLRTLVYVTKELSGSMTQDQIKQMPLSELESNFKLLGVSGVEDLL